ncbi:MAG TPA: peptidase, partial [Brevundimonas sp.]|nr:peptidase [Brevundimonas sp.]
PDFELTYSAGSLPLIISVNSNADTTLVVNAPDARWYCDDDGGNGLNPSLRWNAPMSGTYDIWVGTFGGGNAPATLSISELYSY